jgi:hypothetical protein
MDEASQKLARGGLERRTIPPRLRGETAANKDESNSLSIRLTDTRLHAPQSLIDTLSTNVEAYNMRSTVLGNR